MRIHSDLHSDIARLFSKLAFDINQYQEIASKKSRADWGLLHEINHSVLAEIRDDARHLPQESPLNK